MPISVAIDLRPNTMTSQGEIPSYIKSVFPDSMNNVISSRFKMPNQLARKQQLTGDLRVRSFPSVSGKDGDR
jgi:hypothetical protein